MQDNRCLALALTCYRETNLAENGGLHWLTIRECYKREELCRIGGYTVWGFTSESSRTSPWGNPLREVVTSEQSAASNDLFWDLWKSVRSAGVYECVPHLVESVTAGAGVLHALPGSDNGEPHENELAHAAREAALSLWTGYRREGMEYGYDFLCPVPTHIRNVELVGIARLCHRPHTKKTGAWHRQAVREATRMSACYRAISESRAKTAA